jgi:hypothetical protein
VAIFLSHQYRLFTNKRGDYDWTLELLLHLLNAVEFLALEVKGCQVAVTSLVFVFGAWVFIYNSTGSALWRLIVVMHPKHFMPKGGG